VAVDRTILVRDSIDRTGFTLAFTSDAWQAFTVTIKK
jgi:hypothetical protein